MSSGQVIVLPGIPAAGAAPGGGQKPASVQAQVTQLAQEFEAMLMTQMLRDMRRSMRSDDDQSGGYGAEALSDTTDVELGRALSGAGGFGLAAVLARAITRQSTRSDDTRGEAMPIATPPVMSLPAPSLSPPSEAETAGAALAAAVPAAAAPAATAPEGPVTSAFGFRRDPFTGATRFHSGVDIGLAYGTDVKAAAAGRVVFAGERGGYGNMVIVEQAPGQQMRYAHLSAQAVRTGDRVEAGQVIGQVGDSGRATGPHLHFEVLEDGHAVDPSGLH